MPTWFFNETQGMMQGARGGEFSAQGILTSLSREPIQNSADNPISEANPVRVNYTLNLFDLGRGQVSSFFSNDWLTHMCAPRIGEALTIHNDFPNLANSVYSGRFKALLIEDYNTTGLKGDSNQFRPLFRAPPNANEYTDGTASNTYFWFMRAIDEAPPRRGTGGSFGLGKLALPISSRLRTFFCVTTRMGMNGQYERLLTGHVYDAKSHNFNGTLYTNIMTLGDDILQEPNNNYSWKPITDPNIIDQFCQTFGVTRGPQQVGTSFVIIEPSVSLTRANRNSLSPMVITIAYHYLKPIAQGNLEVGFTWPNTSLTLNQNTFSGDANFDAIFAENRISYTTRDENDLGDVDLAIRYNTLKSQFSIISQI